MSIIKVEVRKVGCRSNGCPEGGGGQLARKMKLSENFIQKLFQFGIELFRFIHKEKMV